MKSIRRTLIMLIIASIMALGLTGCDKETVVATINNEKVSEPIYRIFLWTTQRGLESIVSNFWDSDSIEGKTPEEFAKDRALKSITYNIAVKQKAEELGIKLTKEEKNEIKEAAKKYIAENATFTKAYGIKEKHFEEFLSYGKLNEKVIEKLGENYIHNDEELKTQMDKLVKEEKFAPTATITSILIKNKDEQGDPLPLDKEQLAKQKAEEILTKALNGEEITLLAKQYSEDEAVKSNNGEYTFMQGTMEESLEKVVFKQATPGEVYPELIQTSMGYEIIKVEKVTPIDNEALKNAAIEMIRQNFANQELTQSSELFSVEKTEAYDAVHIMELEDN